MTRRVVRAAHVGSHGLALGIACAALPLAAALALAALAAAPALLIIWAKDGEQ